VKIAFYAPLKPPDHPVPSGDRQMGRLLIEALRRMGHEVEVASTLRAYLPAPAAFCDLEIVAREETARLTKQWAANGRPDLWFCYHPYYRAPDLVGPALSRRFGMPYVTAEASYAGKRNADGWAPIQARVIASVELALVNICFTKRDRDGLARAVPDAVFADLKPFIDVHCYGDRPHPAPSKLVAVAMMRQGDKFRSFTMLAAALDLICDRPWRLAVVGDGPARNDVRALFNRFGPERVVWAGEVAPQDVRSFLLDAAVYVWPGCGEAYGLSYLEAQASGLPVVAQDTAGVPEVVSAGETGILTPEADIAAYASAIRRLLDDDRLRRRMATAARNFVHGQRSLSAAMTRLAAILEQTVPS